MDVAPFVAQGAPCQPLIVSANNIILGHACLFGRTVLRAPIPSLALANADALDIVLYHPHALSPRATGLNVDDRALAFAFRKLSLVAGSAPRPVPQANRQPVAAGRVSPLYVAFGVDGDAEEFQGSGWLQPQAGLTWSTGPVSRLRLPVSQAGGDLLLEFHVEPFARPGRAAQMLIVTVNGVTLREAYVRGEAVLSVPIPAAIYANTSALEIVFYQPDAVWRQDAAADGENRALAFAFHGLWLGAANFAALPVRAADIPGCATIDLGRQPALNLCFGVGGNTEYCQQDGWSDPEDDLTWTIGAASRLRLPNPFIGRDLMLELHVEPFTAPTLPGQRMIVSLNGSQLCNEFLAIETLLCLPVPARMIDGAAMLDIVFRHPDAVSPAALGLNAYDFRALAFSFRTLVVRAAPPRRRTPARTLPALPAADLDRLAPMVADVTGLSLAQLALCFESLGQNCELGLLQRRFGAEPDGLLRFASIPQPGLVDALRHGFAGIADPGRLEVFEIFAPDDPEGEWIIRNTLYGTATHTFLTRQQAAPHFVMWQSQRLLRERYLAMLDRLRLGDRIFVFQHRAVRCLAAIEPVAAALARLGPNVLLWVAENSGYPAGSVTVLQPGLLLGAIDTLAPETAVASGDALAWGSIMANAHRLWRGAA
jgi:hypothetical protein